MLKGKNKKLQKQKGKKYRTEKTLTQKRQGRKQSRGIVGWGGSVCRRGDTDARPATRGEPGGGTSDRAPRPPAPAQTSN